MFVFVCHKCISVSCGVTGCMENLEMSGNLIAVREMSGENLVHNINVLGAMIANV